MNEFSYVIHHILGAGNHRGDLLSRLRAVGGQAADYGEEVPVCVRSIAVVAPTGADYSFPSMGEIRDRQDIYTVLMATQFWTHRLEVWCAVRLWGDAGDMGAPR